MSIKHSVKFNKMPVDKRLSAFSNTTLGLIISQTVKKGLKVFMRNNQKGEKGILMKDLRNAIKT